MVELKVVSPTTGKWGEAFLQALWSHPDALEPVVKGQRSGIKMGYHERSKSEASRLRFIPYIFASVILIAKGNREDLFGDLEMQIEYPH
jgi:hypothetical protein